MKKVDNWGTYNNIVIIFLKSFTKMYRARKNKVEYGAALQLMAEPVNILKKKEKKSPSVKRTHLEAYKMQ